MHVKFTISKPLVLWAWIPYGNEYVLVKFKYERLPKFYYYYGLITHHSIFCEVVSDVYLAFGGKYAHFGE